MLSKIGPIPVFIIVSPSLTGCLTYTECSTLFAEFYVYHCNKIWAKFSFCRTTWIGRIWYRSLNWFILFFPEWQKHYTKSSLWDIPLDMVVCEKFLFISTDTFWINPHGPSALNPSMLWNGMSLCFLSS